MEDTTTPTINPRELKFGSPEWYCYFDCEDLPFLTMSHFITKKELEEAKKEQENIRFKREQEFLEVFAEHHNISLQLTTFLYNQANRQMSFFGNYFCDCHINPEDSVSFTIDIMCMNLPYCKKLLDNHTSF